MTDKPHPPVVVERRTPHPDGQTLEVFAGEYVKVDVFEGTLTIDAKNEAGETLRIYLAEPPKG